MWPFRKRKRVQPLVELSDHDREVLARELQESAEHAMPSNTSDALGMSSAEKIKTFGGGNQIAMRPSDVQRGLDTIDKKARPKPPAP